MSDPKEQITESGMQFNLTFLEDLGVSPYSILEAAWVLPAIIMGVRTKIWNGTYDKKVMPPPIVSLWIDMHLITTTVVSDQDFISVDLTEAGHNIVKMSGLFEYEFSMMQQQLDDNFVTDPAKYRVLRKALSMYSDQYLPPITEWMRERAGTNILDFGGGSGYYLRELLKSNPEAKGTLYDKAPTVEQDGGEELVRMKTYEEDFHSEKSKFFTTQQNTFDTIIFSEVLHCMAIEDYPKVLHLLEGLLTPDGMLIVIEQRPSFRMDWRLNVMTKGGKSLDINETIMRIQTIPDLNLIPSQSITTATHYAVTFTKGEHHDKES